MAQRAFAVVTFEHADDRGHLEDGIEIIGFFFSSADAEAEVLTVVDEGVVWAAWVQEVFISDKARSLGARGGKRKKEKGRG